MADTAAHLVDRVFPDVPVRQWVLSLPFELRYLLARDPELCGKVRRIYVRAIFGLLKCKARQHGIEDPRPGAVVAVQRFDSALRLNVHKHGLFADGVFTCDSVRSRASFHALPAPTDAEVARVTRQIATRVLHLLRKEGLVPDPDAPAEAGADDDLSALDACLHVRAELSRPEVEAVTYDASSNTVSFGVRSTTLPNVSWVCSFPQTSPQIVTVASPALPGRIQNLATRHGPNGVETVAALRDGRGNPTLYLISNGAATPVLPNALHTQWVYLGAVAVEPSTCELLLCGASHVLNSSTYGVHWLQMATGSVTQLSNTLTIGTRGALSGIAVAPALRRSQSPTSCGAASGAYAWSDSCHPDKLPFVGNTSFFIDVDHAPGTTPVFGLALLDFAPATPWPPLPRCPTLLALVPPSASPLPPSSIPPPRPNSTRFGLPLPPWLLPGLQVYLQSAHFTATDIFASDLLEVSIL